MVENSGTVEKLLQIESGQGIKINSGNATYYLLKTDGIKVHHAGFFVPGDPAKFSQLFYAFTKVVRVENGKETEEERVLPFTIIVEYEGGEIRNISIKPLHEFDFVDLGETIAQVEKKSVGLSSLTTQLPLEVVEKVYKGDLPKEPLNEFRRVFFKLREKLKVHIYNEDETVFDVCLCWALATYFFEVFGSLPILELVGVSGSGKTKFGTALCFISKRGLPIADPTDANLSRIIDAFKPTLLLDDWDKVLRNHRRVAHSILKHVYKTGIKIPRLTQIGKRFYVDMFSPSSPLIITTCEEITEEQLRRRIIEINCQRAVRRFQPIVDYSTYFFAFFKEERYTLYLLMFSLLPLIYHTFITLDVDLHPPHLEIWSPILTIAKLVDDEVYKSVLNFALERIKEVEGEVYRDEMLVLEGIERLFQEQSTLSEDGLKVLEFTVSDLWKKLRVILVEEREELNEREFERTLRKQKLGIILTRLNIRKLRKGKGGCRYRVITREEFERLSHKLGYNFTTKGGSDKSDMSDKLLHMREGMDDGKNEPLNGEDDTLKDGKNGGLENPSTCQKVVRLVRLVSPTERYIFQYLNKYRDKEKTLTTIQLLTGKERSEIEKVWDKLVEDGLIFEPREGEWYVKVEDL